MPSGLLKALVLIVSISFVFLIFGCGSSGENSIYVDKTTYSGDLLDGTLNPECVNHLAVGVPGPSDQVLCRDAYAVGYNYTNKVADWVAYHVTADSVSLSYPRNDNFREDLEIPVGYRAVLSDYSGSGYDRGHLAPNATVDYSFNAMDESFLLSNITPQLASFNRGAWASLEEYFRDCTVEVDEMYVVTGTVVSAASGSVGNQVKIPTKYYKAAIKISSPAKAMAFLLPHEDIATDHLPDYLVSVDQLEAEVGIDLFSAVRDDIESSVESSRSAVCALPWAPALTPVPVPTPTPVYSCSTSKTCTQMSSCQEAYYYFNTCGVSRLDGDKDGVPCEVICQ